MLLAFVLYSFNLKNYVVSVGGGGQKSPILDRLEKCILWSRILAHFEGSGF